MVFKFFFLRCRGTYSHPIFHYTFYRQSLQFTFTSPILRSLFLPILHFHPPSFHARVSPPPLPPQLPVPPPLLHSPSIRIKSMGFIALKTWVLECGLRLLFLIGEGCTGFVLKGKGCLWGGEGGYPGLGDFYVGRDWKCKIWYWVFWEVVGVENSRWLETSRWWGHFPKKIVSKIKNLANLF